MSKVCIIILNWNGLKDTLECLDSVCRLDYPDSEVIVVDNCSSDDSVATIRKKYPQVILIENSTNLGYTGGNNVGMRYAMEHGGAYVWLLNNDTVVESDSLSKLVSEAEKSSEIGMVSPTIYFYDSPGKIQSIGSYADFRNHELVHIHDPHELDCESVRSNHILWGTALFIKRSVIETVGYLSEEYFAYHEDCDYSLRVHRAKFRTAVRFDAGIFHKDSKSSAKRSPTQVFLRTRNLYFMWMNNEKWLRKAFVPCHYIGMIIRYAKCLSDEGNEAGVDACLNGGWAAFRRRGGAYDPAFRIPSWFKYVLGFFISWHPHFWISLFKGNVREIIREAYARV